MNFYLLTIQMSGNSSLSQLLGNHLNTRDFQLSILLVITYRLLCAFLDFNKINYHFITKHCKSASNQHALKWQESK